VLEHGHLDATKERSRITALWNRWPDANIGMPTGERSGVFVLDVDDLGALAELEDAIGELPATRAVRTPSGGLHFYFSHAEGVTNSSGALPAGIDVRGEGGYVLVPPSGGYRSEAGGGTTGAVAHAPERLLELIMGKEPKRKNGSGSDPQPVSIDVAGPPIPERGRNVALTAIAGRLHDGSHTLKELEEDLESVNRARCPHPLDRKEVAKIARSIHWRPPCSRARPEEIERAVGAAEERFWELVANELRGLGGQSVRDALRAIIEGAARYGRLRTDGRIEYDQSLFETALAAGISRPTLDRVRPLLLEKTGIRRAPRRTPTDAGAWVLPSGTGEACAPTFTTHASTSRRNLEEPGVRVVKACASPTGRRRLADAVTPCSRHFSPTNKGKGGVLLIAEVFGDMSREEVASVLGIERARDAERRYLRPLEEEGRLVRSGGCYSLPADHARRCEEARQIPYGGGERIVRTRTSEGRTVSHTVERDVMSEAERDARDKRRYEEQRKVYLARLVASARALAEENDDCRELLNAWDEEREVDGTIAELTPVAEPCPTPEIVEALAAALLRWPDHRNDYPSWWASTLFVEDYLPYKPTGEQVEVALAELQEAVA
jgi:hypothetical protein